MTSRTRTASAQPRCFVTPVVREVPVPNLQAAGGSGW